MTNVSDVATTIQLRCPKESIAFISKIGDKDIAFEDNCVWEFGLRGNQKREIKITFMPRVPGSMYVPIYVKIGHLEEIMIPVTAEA